jgi:glutamate racemase
MITKNPIGLFDSGIGGTSIWKEINTLLPYENAIYLADSKNAPYGLKSKEEILELCYKNTEFLLNKNCKIIVVACNTATTNAIKELRVKYDIPFIGIEPAIKPAANQTKTQTIGILATKGTLNSSLFHESIANYSHIKIIEQVGYGLVQLIESGEINSIKMEMLLKKFINPMVEQNIDYLVLGCSHYPYLIPQIKKIVPKTVKIIDSGEAVAKQTLLILKQHNMLNISKEKSIQLFYTNSDPSVLKQIVGNDKNVIQENF